MRHAVRKELARTVDDVARRTRLGLGACGGMRCAARCGQIVAAGARSSPRRGARDGAGVPRAASADARRRDGPGAGAARGARRSRTCARRSERARDRGRDGPRPVVVVGGGVAGTAAALAAARAGADVILVDGGSGRVDALDRGHRRRRPGSAGRDRFRRRCRRSCALSSTPSRRSSSATRRAVVDDRRGSRGPRAAATPRSSIATLARVPAGRPSSAAPSPGLGRGRAGTTRGGARGFVADRRRRPPDDDEERIPDADFAARHDDDARLGWLADAPPRGPGARRRGGRRYAAVALPPCARASTRSRAEALSAPRRRPLRRGHGICPAGPAGLRFERRATAPSRRPAFAGDARPRHARRGRRDGEGWRVHVEDGPVDSMRAPSSWRPEASSAGASSTCPPRPRSPAASPPGLAPPLRATVDAPVVASARTGGRWTSPARSSAPHRSRSRGPFAPIAAARARRGPRRRRRRRRAALRGRRADRSLRRGRDRRRRAAHVAGSRSTSGVRAREPPRARVSADAVSARGARRADAATCQPTLSTGSLPFVGIVRHVLAPRSRSPPARLRPRLARPTTTLFGAGGGAARLGGEVPVEVLLAVGDGAVLLACVSTATSGCTPSAWIAWPLGV